MIRPFYLPHHVAFAEVNGTTVNKLLVQCTTNSRAFKPGLLPTFITVNIIVPMHSPEDMI
jgi:hypothetical protein